MRLQLEDTDSDRQLLYRSRYITVMLDGAALRGCVMVDEEAGAVDRYVQPMADDGTGRAQMERVHGNVVIGLRDDAPDEYREAYARLRSADLPIPHPAA